MIHRQIKKKDIAKQLSIHMGWTIKKSDAFVSSIFEWITKKINDKKKVIITGFGTFQLNKRKPRLCIHPKTKEKIILPERFCAHFSTSTHLLKKINSGAIK